TMMKTEDIIKYALIAAGAYLVWEYIIQPMMNAPAAAPATGTTAAAPTTTTQSPVSTQPVQIAAPTTTIPPTASVNTPNANIPLIQALQAAAGNVSSLTIDQWAYYYNNMPGKT